MQRRDSNHFVRFPPYEGGEMTNFSTLLYYFFLTFYKYYIIIFKKVQNLKRKDFWKLMGLPTLAEDVGLEPLSKFPKLVCKPLHLALDRRVNK